MNDTTWHDSILDVPEAERRAAQEAELLAAKAMDAARPPLDLNAMHTARRAMKDHERETGWRYLTSSRYYLHRTRTDTTP